MESLTVAQINTHYCKAAMAQLSLYTHDNKVDTALIQEPYCYNGEPCCNPPVYSAFATSNRNPRALVLIKKDIAHNFLFLHQFSNPDSTIVATATNPPQPHSQLLPPSLRHPRKRPHNHSVIPRHNKT